jgi:hypothetical protein
MERASSGEWEDTQETDEIPPLAAHVSALPEAVQLSLKDGVNAQTLFLFARALKAFEITVRRKLSGDELADAFALWWRTAAPSLPTDADFDEWRFSFQSSWAKTHSPFGANQLEEAIRRADAAPSPAQAHRYQSLKLKRLVAVCYHLQRLVGNGAFFLSARDAARVVGIKQPGIALDMLKGLVADKVLNLVSPGTAAGRKATRYRFNAPEFARVEIDAVEHPRTHPATSSTEARSCSPQKCAKPEPTHFQLVEKKKALEDLLKTFEGKDRADLSAEQRKEHQELRAKRKEVTRKLATFGD